MNMLSRCGAGRRTGHGGLRRRQVRAEVDRIEVRRQVRCQVWGEVRRQVRCQVWCEVRREMWCQVRREVRREVRGQVRREEVAAGRREPAAQPVRPAGAAALLRRHWRSCPDAQLQALLQQARDSVSAFADATAQRGSLLQSWIEGAEVLEFEHYPSDDLVDVRSGSQFYYHCHRSGGVEHGHLHLFWHATASGRRRYLPRQGRRWARTAPSHLFAISLDARGLPVALFTVNRWVTDGHWFDAATTLSQVERFVMHGVEGHEASCRWLNGFVRLYEPLLAGLLAQRDRRLARRADLGLALADRRLEVLSTMPIDWSADLDALEAEAARRGRLSASP